MTEQVIAGSSATGGGAEAPRPRSSWATWVTGSDRRVHLGLVAATLVAFLPAMNGDFVWDDDANVTQNPNLEGLDGLVRTWTEPHANQQYYPLSYTTFWLNHAIDGLEPLGYHLVNVALHATGAILFYQCLKRLGLRAAAFAAALFALHPLNAESVAWVTERKNVLSAALAMGAVLLYLRYDDAAFAAAPPAATTERRRLWAGALGLFVLALLAKTSVAVVPAALFLVLWLWRGRRGVRLFAPIAPLFAVGIAAGLGTAWLERAQVGAVGNDFAWSFAYRVAVAGRAFCFYLGKLVVPSGLMFLYPRWSIEPGSAAGIFFPLLAVALAAAAFLLRKRLGPGPLTAVLAYAVLVFPALGFFNVYFMRYAFVQNHFAYLATAPVLALMASAGERVLRARPVVAAATAGGALVLSAVLTAREAASFDGYERLFVDSLARNPEAWVASDSLASYYIQNGHPEEGLRMLDRSLRARPDDFGVLTTWGLAMLDLDRTEEAVEPLRRAILRWPENPSGYVNLARAFEALGRDEEAAEQCREALRRRPGWPRAQRQLAWLLATAADERVRDGQAAIALATEGCAGSPNLARCFDLQAAAFAAAGDFERARAHARRAVELAGADPVAGVFAARAALYQRGRAFVDAPQKPASPPARPPPAAPPPQAPRTGSDQH